MYIKLRKVQYFTKRFRGVIYVMYWYEAPPTSLCDVLALQFSLLSM